MFNIGSLVEPITNKPVYTFDSFNNGFWCFADFVCVVCWWSLITSWWSYCKLWVPGSLFYYYCLVLMQCLFKVVLSRFWVDVRCSLWGFAWFSSSWCAGALLATKEPVQALTWLLLHLTVQTKNTKQQCYALIAFAMVTCQIQAVYFKQDFIFFDDYVQSTWLVITTWVWPQGSLQLSISQVFIINHDHCVPNFTSLHKFHSSFIINSITQTSWSQLNSAGCFKC